ncbi:MAG: hypothetical protein KKE23_02755 [Nanoarchaeota archaeon]|nr:hypothetical protein [Nanoarchaeota archaeon]
MAMKEGLSKCFDGSNLYYRFSKPIRKKLVVLFLHGLGNNYTIFSHEE